MQQKCSNIQQNNAKREDAAKIWDRISKTQQKRSNNIGQIQQNTPKTQHKCNACWRNSSIVFAFLKNTRLHPSATPQAGLTAPQAAPAETLAILLSSSPNLGSSAAVLSTWKNATQPGFPIFLRPNHAPDFRAQTPGRGHRTL